MDYIKSFIIAFTSALSVLFYATIVAAFDSSFELAAIVNILTFISFIVAIITLNYRKLYPIGDGLYWNTIIVLRYFIVTIFCNLMVIAAMNLIK